MNIARRANDQVRRLFAMNAGKLAIGRGVRTAFALLVPVVVGDLLNQPLFSWAALGGWLGSLADKGGSYRTRAATMSALAILGAACAFAGTETRAQRAAGDARDVHRRRSRRARARVRRRGIHRRPVHRRDLRGRDGLALRRAAHLRCMRAEMFLGGVAWAMVLSLLLWPLHPFRPARRAVAKSYRALANFALRARSQ